ncbi:transposase [Streptococcus pneumoniae]|nr:transposase [Streptococcus pneumoniae]
MVNCEQLEAYRQLEEAALVGCWAHVRPLLEDFFAWCRRQSVLSGSKLGRAIEYSLKYEETFKTILKDGHLVLSNNLAERAIKSLVMGRSKRVQWTLLA